MAVPRIAQAAAFLGRMVGFALLAVVAACGLVVLAFAALFVMAMATVGSNK